MRVGAYSKMMGPPGFNQKFKPGTLVVINPSTAIYHGRRAEYGTIIDNFDDIRSLLELFRNSNQDLNNAKYAARHIYA